MLPTRAATRSTRPSVLRFAAKVGMFFDRRGRLSRNGPDRSGGQAIFITGYSAENIDGKGLLEPGLDVLMKPLVPLVILRKARSRLDSGAPGRSRT